MEAIFVLLSALFCYLIYCALRGGQKRTHSTIPQTASQVPDRGKSFPFSELLPDPSLPHFRLFHTKIRGVTFTNNDGASRQQIIRRWCRSGDALYLSRDPKNPVDRNAIQVRRILRSDDPNNPRLGEQLGYLSRELAEELAPMMDNQRLVLMAQITDVTGGNDGESFGVNIQVNEYRPAQQMVAHPKKPASRQKRDQNVIRASS